MVSRSNPGSLLCVSELALGKKKRLTASLECEKWSPAPLGLRDLAFRNRVCPRRSRVLAAFRDVLDPNEATQR